MMQTPEHDEVKPDRRIVEGELLWTPSSERIATAPITTYMEWLSRERGKDFADYSDLWTWSTTAIEDFWASLWDYFDIISDTPYDRVLDTRVMPGGRWFEGSRVNFAEHVLRHENTNSAKPAIRFQSEGGELGTMTWAQLGAHVRALASTLREMDVQPGDRVVSYLQNVPEAVIAMLATAAVGAIWASAAPEFGAKTILERFQQLEPAVILVGDGYRFGGKTFDRISEAEFIIDGLPTLRHVIWVAFLGVKDCTIAGAVPWATAVQPSDSEQKFHFERVEFDHPLWVLFSSGTTGIPKAIAHSHIGALIELLKLTHLQLSIDENSTTLIHTTTGWMLWNVLVGALLNGGTIVLYDGSPMHPTPNALWYLAEQTGVTSLGTSSAYLVSLEKSETTPGTRLPLEHLDMLFLSGSPTTPETYDWILRNIKSDLWINSISGGTEICTAFVGGVETLPVYAGEMQARMLGLAVQAWSEDGCKLNSEIGELVCTAPFPSMPLKFWNDDGDRRYHNSYFTVFPGVWRHGDFLKINERGGCYIYGRSDSTLNRHGVRIGTAEIYRAIDQIDEIADSLIVGLELAGGRYNMPLFVQLRPGARLDEELRGRINTRLREDYSPRHVPDTIFEVSEIPYTLTGKKMEVPVRRILLGHPLERSASVDAMRNPESLDYFLKFAKKPPGS